MTRPAFSDTHTPISSRAAELAMVAILTYQFLVILLIFLRPDLDPSWHSVSEWAIGPHGWIMSVAFLISGLSYGALFVMLRPHLRSTLGRIGLGILLICVAGAVGVGIFTTDPVPFHYPLSTTGTLHLIFGASQLVLLPFAALSINLALARKNGVWEKARRPLLWTAALPLFGFSSFAVYTELFVVPLGPQAYGPGVDIGWPPRFAFFTYVLWVITLAWQAIRSSHLNCQQCDS